MKSHSTTHTWIMRSTPKPDAALRLFCLPYAGGGSVIFHRWGGELPADIEVCAIKLPGRETRLSEPPFTRVAPLVRALVEGLTPDLDRPFALFGHSLGGLVSFELAQELLRQQRPAPVHLLVSAIRAPHIPATRPGIHGLPTPAFIARLRDFQGTPDAILNNRNIMELLMPALRADFAISETHMYSAQAPLACPITVFGGQEDTLVSEEALRAWQRHTHNTFTMHTIPGNHFFIHSARSAILKKVEQALRPHLRHDPSTSVPCSLEEASP
jgi:medium-chain acyl-[acyl-carrier-protein] hydrolase